ncbi:MAG: xanthine dehydrogenase family protein subunit M [Thermincola sp.]|nr:xanthine dehydrogenase family protein subunit M [Thermincola sp.]MDT3702605.1 xanthine dehydrogenase family protein subunit M [Thermincola sp.]
MMEMEYYEPTTWAEACRLLDSSGEDTKVIAGGQSLIILLKQRVVMLKNLISLKGITEGSYIKESADGKNILIGSLTTHRQVHTSPLVREKIPGLAQMAGGIGSIAIQNWGTIGGSVSHADPGGDPAPLLIALGAKLKIQSNSAQREELLENFITGTLETNLGHKEIVTEIVVPVPTADTGEFYKKEAVRQGDMAIVGAAAKIQLTKGGKKINKAAVIVNGIGEKPLRLNGVENSLIGQEWRNKLDFKLDIIDSIVRPDPWVSKEYKLDVTRELVKNVITECCNRAAKTI